MADIIHSGEQPPVRLMDKFKAVVEFANKKYLASIQSPLTITLGDEFQSIVNSLNGAVDLIIGLEEEIVNQNAGFKLRYVLNQGLVETEINTDTAHGMLGKGLTEARKMLNQQKKKGERFFVSLQNEELGLKANQLFSLYQHFVDGWYAKDIETASAFINGKKYTEVAKEQGKDESSLWRKEKSMAIKEYNTCKALIREIIRE